MFKTIINYAPSITIAIAFLVIGVFLYNSTKPKPYEPLQLKEIRVIDSTVHPGESVSYSNGLCVKSATPIVISAKVGFVKEVSADSAAETVSIFDDQLPLLPNRCQFEGILKAKIPETVTPGTWRMYVILTTAGEKANQVQRISVLSNIFTVLPSNAGG